MNKILWPGLFWWDHKNVKTAVHVRLDITCLIKNIARCATRKLFMLTMSGATAIVLPMLDYRRILESFIHCVRIHESIISWVCEVNSVHIRMHVLRAEVHKKPREAQLNAQELCVLLRLLWRPCREIFKVGLLLVFERPHRWSRNSACGQIIPHIHYPLAEGKLAQIKPRSILSQF